MQQCQWVEKNFCREKSNSPSPEERRVSRWNALICQSWPLTNHSWASSVQMAGHVTIDNKFCIRVQSILKGENGELLIAHFLSASQTKVTSLLGHDTMEADCRRTQWKLFGTLQVCWTWAIGLILLGHSIEIRIPRVNLPPSFYGIGDKMVLWCIFQIWSS